METVTIKEEALTLQKF